MKRVTEHLIDDLDQESTAAMTLTFAIEGVNYEIDLCEANRLALHESVAPYVEAARRIAVKPPRGTGHDGLIKTERDTIRQWGNKHGFAHQVHGRIPNALMDAYRDAH